MTTKATTPAGIHVETKHVPPSDISLPALAIQATRLVDSYMLWIGTTQMAAESVAQAPLQGRLGKDWACAMPARDLSSVSPAATSLFRSSNSDAALSIAQRLGRRFKKQIFLSLDLPPAFDAMGQGGGLLLAVERALLETLKEMEKGPNGAES